MSRVGRMPIAVPQGVEVTIKGNEIKVKGPKGELQRSLSHDMSVTLQDGNLVVTRPTDNRMHRSMHGLTRTLLANMVEGVNNGFEKTLEIVGAGYRAQKADEKVVVRVGFSHQVEVTPLAGVSLDVEGTNRIKVSGISKEMVGEMAAEIRANEQG